MREQDEYLIIALHLKNLMIVERYSAMEKIVFPELGHSDLGGLKTLSWRRGVVRSSTLPSGRWKKAITSHLCPERISRSHWEPGSHIGSTYLQWTRILTMLASIIVRAARCPSPGCLCTKHMTASLGTDFIHQMVCRPRWITQCLVVSHHMRGPLCPHLLNTKKGLDLCLMVLIAHVVGSSLCWVLQVSEYGYRVV